jgi:DNA-binding transcriptional LysR family regulator
VSRTFASARRRKETHTSGDVTLRQLRYFAALGEELNYRRAAERLFITQPALSTAIKALEHQLGVMLFTRTTREVTLTALGQVWLPKVKDALRGVDSAVDEVVALSGGRGNRIRLGYFLGTGADLLYRIVRHFEATYPDITIEPTEFDFSDPTAGLGDRTTEVALTRSPLDLPNHRMYILDRDDWVACLPRDHRLADRAEVDIAELLDDPIVCAPDSAGGWRDYWIAAEARSRPATIAAVAATYEAETTYIARGLGISFTTESVSRLYGRPGIVYVPIRDRTSYIGLVWNPADLSPQACTLVRHVETEWEFAEGQGVERPASHH